MTKTLKQNAEVKTFGCRLNIWESEVMSRHLKSAGLDDAVVINTCAVTAEAEKQARQMIRKSGVKTLTSGLSSRDAPPRSTRSRGKEWPKLMR